MFVPPTQNSYVETLTPKGDCTKRWGPWEGRALMSGINALIKEVPERPFVCHLRIEEVCDPDEALIPPSWHLV